MLSKNEPKKKGREYEQAHFAKVQIKCTSYKNVLC